MTPQDPAKQTAATAPRQRRTLLRRIGVGFGLTCCVVLVYLVSLVATMPAAALRDYLSLPSQIEHLYGSVWDGRADLAHGYGMTWDTRFGALWRLRIEAAVEVTGPDTRLTATVWRGLRGTGLRDVAGRAGPGLLALAPGLPLRTCTSRAVVAVDRAAIGPDAARADGTVTTDAGTCTDRAGREIPIPALTLSLTTEGVDAVAVLTGGLPSPLAEARLSGTGRLALRIESEGARLVPGMPSSAATTLEFPLW